MKKQSTELSAGGSAAGTELRQQLPNLGSAPAPEFLQVKKEGVRCVMPCPYRQRLGEDLGGVGIDEIMLGSHACLHCDYNAGHKYTEKGEIVCAYLHDSYFHRIATEEVQFKKALEDENFLNAHATYSNVHGPITEAEFFVKVYRPAQRFHIVSKSKRFKKEYTDHCATNKRITPEEFFATVYQPKHDRIAQYIQEGGAQ